MENMPEVPPCERGGGNAITKFINGEISGWSRNEILWISSAFAAIAVLSEIIDDNNPLALTASLTGVAYTLLAGKGKSSCYLFGFINVILYGYICYQEKVYGDMVLNLAFYLPLQVIGFILWIRNRNSATGDIVRKKLSWPIRWIFLAGTILLWICGSLLLKQTDAASPWLDSATTVISITAMLLGVMRCFEQWIGWSLVNSISVIMWARLWYIGNAPVAPLTMWIIFLICGIVFAVQWHKSTPQKVQK